MMTNDDSETTELRAQLRALPVLDQPSGLFARIERTRLRRRRQRRAWAAAGCSAMLALLLLPLWMNDPLGIGPSSTTEVAREILAPAAEESAGRAANHSAEARLRQIDRRLQAAYESGATAGHLQSLWLQRETAEVLLQQEHQIGRAHV